MINLRPNELYLVHGGTRCHCRSEAKYLHTAKDINQCMRVCEAANEQFDSCLPLSLFESLYYTVSGYAPNILSYLGGIVTVVLPQLLYRWCGVRPQRKKL